MYNIRQLLTKKKSFRKKSELDYKNSTPRVHIRHTNATKKTDVANHFVEDSRKELEMGAIVTTDRQLESSSVVEELSRLLCVCL